MLEKKGVIVVGRGQTQKVIDFLKEKEFSFDKTKIHRRSSSSMELTSEFILSSCNKSYEDEIYGFSPEKKKRASSRATIYIIYCSDTKTFWPGGDKSEREKLTKKSSAALLRTS